MRFVLLLALLASPFGHAQDFRVATKESPPFSMKNDEGNWEGVSIDIWEWVAADAGIDFAYEEADLNQMLEGVSAGNYQAAVSAITLTSEREKTLDFSHSYYKSGLGIATRAESEGLNWWAVIKAFFSWQFFSALFALLLVLLAAGFAIWLFERRANPEQFGGSRMKGIGDGFWWSAVTMTTVGYGDKAPVTFGGRIVALIWMFTSIIVISGFTASIATSLTVNSMGSSIETADDLEGRRVGTLGGTASEAYLREIGAKPVTYPNIGDAIQALQGKAINSLVYDKDLLKYYLPEDESIRILPINLRSQDYAIALNVPPEQKEQINQSLLRFIESGQLPNIRERYGLQEN
ncbi:transporter substrate-binding domain-containing protein [Pelagicoccus sp. SDUM812005]|uniref:transporter substrate-binding domain-containing protein n=1 Tax=Pelagicoccus sp. SDUM812005 TaxID=3041257 RepID=UPI00280DA365|nr:transporter substrate-binding domain-containing protein [Pelagicoccus sp. SDUM812005]MDQ8181041.1 transporter substrate-binding domain-containing protein [Pelagicoccus sp. SDUM812005]